MENATPVKFNEALRQRLLELRAGPTKDDFSNNKMAKKLGVNSSYVSQYCTGKDFSGDLSAFERKLEDFFRNEARRRLSGVETIANDETKAIAGALEVLRKLNEIGCVVLASGGGKTRGEELYLKENPTAIHFQVRAWNNDKNSIEGALFKSVGAAGWDGRTKRADFLVTKLTGSDRLLLIGDAHKLTKAALQWVVDFWEATLIPIALVGTHALHDLLMSDTQRFSRIQLWNEIKPSNDKTLIVHLAKSLMPELNGELETVCDLGEQIVTHEGLYRAVYKQFKLAEEIRVGAKKPITHAQAVRSAHTKLLRDWQLN
jgi:DNA transposition AAA+ family ATPase